MNADKKWTIHILNIKTPFLFSKHWLPYISLPLHFLSVQESNKNWSKIKFSGAWFCFMNLLGHLMVFNSWTIGLSKYCCMYSHQKIKDCTGIKNRTTSCITWRPTLEIHIILWSSVLWKYFPINSSIFIGFLIWTNK